MKRRMVLLTWGHTNPRTAKTATGLLRYCPEECVAVLDPDRAGQDTEALLGVGRGVPIIGSLDEAPDADTLAIGIAPPGGKIPAAWRPVLLQAVARKMHLLSGLHDFLSDDEELRAAAEQHGATITDVRKNSFKQIARFADFNPDCFRLHTVGHDCSVGKMLASLELARGLQQRRLDAQFVATGQTGIMVSGAGLPIDCMVADFVNGAAEQLVLDNQQHEIIVVEGQGSLVHPAYSAVTLGLLHGCRPHALVFVFEAGRTTVGGIDHVPLPSLARQIALFETMASIYQPCSVIAMAMNGSRLSPDQARQVADQTEQELQLPVVDIVRDGPDRLLDTVASYYRSGRWKKHSATKTQVAGWDGRR
ncbi:MAG: DUF1611 domain-containing protein [Planctomycetota bacterium]|nr:MAG: DUF1611 domain-containing protein [Planctomycetota bacterium]